MESESIALLMFVLWWCFNRWWMVGSAVLHKVFIGASSNRIFSNKDFSRSNEHDTYVASMDISTFYFNEQLLLQIFFRPL